MTVVAPPPPEAAPAADGDGDQNRGGTGGRHSEVETQIRGSSLLLFGRLMAMVANLGVQVLIVRALTRADYGIFAYALSMITVLTTIVTFGLDRGLARFVTMYEERGDLGRMWGVLALQVITILGLGAAAAVVAIGAQGMVAGTLVDDPRLARLLAVMVVLAPVQALDNAAATVFACFGRSKAIFVRRYVLNPVLRLTLVIAILLLGGDVFALGAGHVVVGLIGLAVYGGLLTRTFRQRGLLGTGTTPPRIRLPVRDVAVFTVPLLMSDAVLVALNTTDVVILARVAGSEAVAGYRAVLPLAHLNQVVMNSFALLFAPLMARLWTRGDRAGLGDAYWRTAAWVAVLTFPVAAVTVGLADPIVAILFGDRYAGSGTYLTILGAAAYFNSSLGFNGVTVKMVGRVWLVTAAAAAGLVVNVVLAVTLIPAHGAIGAAWSTAGTVCLYNVAKHLTLRRATGVELVSRRYRSVYLTVAVGGAAVVLAAAVDAPIAVAVTVVVAASVAVLLRGRRELAVDAMFPELLRIPLLGRFLAAGTRDGAAPEDPS